MRRRDHTWGHTPSICSEPADPPESLAPCRPSGHLATIHDIVLRIVFGEDTILFLLRSNFDTNSLRDFQVTQASSCCEQQCENRSYFVFGRGSSLL
jgi:hypothetical protein